MSIEFHCSHCQSILRVPDEVAGRKAQCPYCEEIQIVPSHTEESHEDSQSMEPQPIPSGAAPPQEPERALPIPPSYHSDAPPFSFDAGSQSQILKPTQPGFSEMFQKTWDTFFSRIGDFILIGLINLAATIPASVLWGCFQVLAAGIEQQDNNEVGEGLLMILLMVYIVVGLLSFLLQMYLFVGGIRYSLHLIRGGESKISIMFPNIRPAVYFIISSLLVGFIMLTFIILAIVFFLAVGAALIWITDNLLNADVALVIQVIAIVIAQVVLLVAIIAVSIRFLIIACFIIDRGEGPLQAIQSSFAYTSGSSLALFGLFFVYSMISLALMFCTCGAGTFLVYPLVQCYTAVAYLLLTGQFPNALSQQYDPPGEQDFQY